MYSCHYQLSVHKYCYALTMIHCNNIIRYMHATAPKLDSISRDTTCDGAATTSDASLQSNYLKLARYVAENVLKATFEKLPFEKMFGTNMAGYCLNFTVLCEENNYFIA